MIYDYPDKEIEDLELHDILQIHKPPYFRVMRVATGWLYNFWEHGKDDYNLTWQFVPATPSPTDSTKENNVTSKK